MIQFANDPSQFLKFSHFLKNIQMKKLNKKKNHFCIYINTKYKKEGGKSNWHFHQNIDQSLP